MDVDEPGSARDPHLPPLVRIDDLRCPRAPRTIADVRLDDGALIELAAKFVHTIDRYRQQGRELRACEPRDLIERACDFCRFHGRTLELTPEVLDLAWTGYFGTPTSGAVSPSTAMTAPAEAAATHS